MLYIIFNLYIIIAVMRNIVLIPTYNEKENILKIVPEILKNLTTDILIIDDNSPDGTGQLADKLAQKNSAIHVLHRPKKEGLGRAYIAAYHWVLSKDYQFIFQIDADYSHDPKYLSVMAELIKTNDLVIGSRYIAGVSCYNWPFRRILLSKLANAFMMRIAARIFIKDLTSGFKCFRREVLAKININSIKSNGYSFQIETSYRAYKLGFGVKEVPIIFNGRHSGDSKLSKRVIIEAALLALTMFLGLYRFKPTKELK